MIIKQNREPAFDALRVYLLILGFIFHSALSYTNTPLDELWPYKDKSQAILFDGISAFIHCFRMPAFFFISGYFVEKMFRSQDSFIVLKKRMFRLGIPFIMAMLICFPIINIGFSLCNGVDNVFLLDSIYPKYDSLGSRIHTSYIWFLYYLLIFSIIHLVIPKETKNHRKYNNGISLLIFILTIVLLLILVMLFDNQNDLHGHYSFKPKFTSLFGFFTYYFSGLIFARKSNYLKIISDKSVLITILAVIALPIYFYVYTENQNFVIDEPLDSLKIKVIYSLTSVILTFSTLGLFVRYCRKSSSWIKFLADSSFFLYLIHLPIILLAVAFLSNDNLSAGIKFIIVLSTSITISLILNFLRVSITNKFKHIY
jgi:peptidoglycan/LPS O-acetylase OafA/YrhL